MAELPDPFPAEDETPDALLADGTDFLVAKTGGDYVPQSADFITAGLASDADELAIFYALLREKADDWLRDYGREVLGVPDPQPVPATTTTSWTARDTQGGVLAVGDTLVVNAISGPVAFEVLEPATVPAGQTVTGVPVQAIIAGAAANGAAGSVDLDDAPAWVAAVLVEAPALGGADADDDPAFMAKIGKAAQLQFGAVVDARDAEIAIQDVAGIDRALVRNHFDLDTGDDQVPGTLSIWPIDRDGESVTDPTLLQRAQDRIDGPSRMLLGVMKFGVVDYTTIDISAVVGVRDGFDPDDVDAQAEQAAAAVIDPADFGQPALGQTRLWRLRTLVRRSEIAAAIDRLDGVEYATKVVLTVTAGPGTVIASAAPSDDFEVGDVLLAGYGPMPRPGTVMITTATSPA